MHLILATTLCLGLAPAPQPKAVTVTPGYYQLLSGGVWDYHLREDGTLYSTHPHTTITYSGRWKFDPRTSILTIEQIGSFGSEEKWTTSEHLISATGSTHRYKEIDTYFRRIDKPRPPAEDED